MTIQRLGGVVLAALLAVSCVGVGTAPPPSFASAVGFERVAPEAVGLSSERLARVDRAFDTYVDEGKLAGYQLWIARRGRLAHTRRYGKLELESGRELPADAIYRIYSMSKVVTGVATMIAHEQGLFRLAEPVAKYLPELADLQVLRPGATSLDDTVPALRPITILDLLRHTSGIPYSFLAPTPLREAYVEASLTPGIVGLPDDTPLGPAGRDRDATLADMVTRIGELPLMIQPGSAWLYGINMDVLGRLIEVTSGKSFPDFLRTELFEPLGMRDTGFFVPEEKLHRFAACYGPTPDGGLRLLDAPATSDYRFLPAMPGGGGGMVSTVRDYLRFAVMLAQDGELDGTRILSRKTVDLLMANHLAASEFGPRPLAATASRTYANDGLGVGFGLTGSVIVEPGLTGLPVSQGSFGWGGAASTFFWADREEELAVVFMTQLVLSGTYEIRPQLLSLVNSAIVD